MTTGQTHTVPALDRMMELLTLLEREPEGGGLRQLAARSGIARTTAYRILNTLEAHRLVTRRADGTYCLGSRLLGLAAAVPQAAPWQDIAARAATALQAIAAASGETARLSVRDGDSVLCIGMAQGHGPSALAAVVGARFPLHAGAASKILLAALDPAARVAAAGERLARYTDRTITGWRSLSRELDEVRAQGWARDAGEYRDNVHAVAIGLPAAAGQPEAAVSVAFVGGPAMERERRLVKLLRGAVARHWAPKPAP